jgi:hypothetical protein
MMLRQVNAGSSSRMDPRLDNVDVNVNRLVREAIVERPRAVTRHQRANATFAAPGRLK